MCPVCKYDITLNDFNPEEYEEWLNSLSLSLNLLLIIIFNHNFWTIAIYDLAFE